MLAQFKFNNFKCFRDETILNLVASNYFKDAPDNITSKGFYSVVNTAVVYGANASGKTKLFQAFNFMRAVVLHSANNKNNGVWQDLYDTFKLNTATTAATSSFEVVFLIGDIQYRYGFELNKETIIAEWLFRKKVKEICIIYRDDSELTYNSRYFNPKIAENLKSANMVRPDALFLSALSVWNDVLASDITNWFSNANVISTSINNFMGYSLSKLDTPMKDRILSMLKGADIGIEDIEPNEVSVDSIPDEIKRMLPKEALNGKFYNGIKTIHKVYDENQMPAGTTALTLETDESYGTAKIFALSAPIIDTLEGGKILWIDEFDNGLHYQLLVALIKLFHSPKTNPHNAQLIINTHNVGLLNEEELFRRDQIYVTSKNRYGESFIKPITDYSDGAILRKSAKIGKLYLDGRLGGTPNLNNFENSIMGL